MTTRKRHQAMREVPVTASKSDLDRRVTAFDDDDSDGGLTITLHGHRFRYVAPDAKTAVETPELLPIERSARRA